ncbi:ADP-ribosylation/Crystallin J1 [Lyophyllum atratum]|nr:ADP-ribosylation/Crystallin J1 [Lyophyllum atratum]
MLLNSKNGTTTISTHVNLGAQKSTLAPPSTKIRLAILATAMVDALGGPPEFHARFSFPLVTTMIPNNNFSLPPGVWTDDTSMTLCLARSLATFTPKSNTRGARTGGFDEKNQLDTYTAWHREGKLSAIGRCFDIGSTIRRALYIYGQHLLLDEGIDEALHHIDAELNDEHCAGNGSLMRVLPIGLAYWRDEGMAKEYARRSSRTTHPNAMCQEACEVWTAAIVRIMQASVIKDGGGYTKLDLVKFFGAFPYTNDKLREALALPSGAPSPPAAKEEHEIYYWTHHPILRLIAKTQTGNLARGFSRTIPTSDDLPSTGYVLHSLVAALYCFLATETFEEGAIMAVNLGSDADTVGAIYAGIAGCWYASGEGDKVEGVFWTQRVIEWRAKLVKKELVEEVGDELAEFSAKLA